MSEEHEITLPEWELDKLSSLVAKRVEDKFMAKFGRWMVVNLLAVGVMAGSGLIAFLNLSADVDKNATLGSLRDRRIEDLVQTNSSFRAELLSKVDKINDKLDEVKLNLASHNGLVPKKQ